MRQEALLPDTKAIPRGTVEVRNYQGKILVRCKHLDGLVERQTFTDADAAHAYTWNCAERLRQEARKSGPLPDR
jgi:hypothetical protein